MATLYDKSLSNRQYGTGSFSLVTICASSEGGSSLAGKGNWTVVDTDPATTEEGAMPIYTSALQGTSITGTKGMKSATFTNLDMGIYEDLELARQDNDGASREILFEDDSKETIYDGANSASGYYVDAVCYGTKYFDGTSNMRILTAIHGFIGGESSMETAQGSETQNNFTIVPVKAGDDIVIPATAIEPDAVTTPAAITIEAATGSTTVVQACA
jgi:hypothetical protein